MTDILISQKYESQEKRRFLLDNQLNYLKEIRSTVFQSVEFVASQQLLDGELSQLIDSLRQEVDDLCKTLEHGQLRGHELSQLLYAKQNEIADWRLKKQVFSADKEKMAQRIDQLTLERQSLVEEYSKENQLYINSVSLLSKVQADYEALLAQVQRNRILIDEKQQKCSENSKLINNFATEQQQLEQEIHLITDRVEQIDLQVMNQVSQISENDRKTKELKSEIVAITHQLKNQDSRHFQYSERIAEQGVKIAQLRNENKRIAKQWDETIRLVKQQVQQIERNDVRISEQQKILQEKNSDLGKKQQQYIRNKNQLAEQEKRLEEKLKVLNLLEGQLAEELTELNMQNISLRLNRNEIVALKAKIVTAEAEYADTCSKVEQNRNSLIENKEIISKSKVQLQKLEVEMLAKSTLCFQLEKELSGILIISNDRKMAVDDYSKRLHFLSQKTEELSIAIKHADAKTAQYEQQLSEIGHHVEAKTILLEELQSSSENKRQRLSDLNCEISNKSCLKVELNNKIEDLNLLHSRLELELANYLGQIADLDQEFLVLSDQLSLQDAMINQNRSAISDLEVHCLPLQAEVDRLKLRLQNGGDTLLKLIESNEQKKRDSHTLQHLLRTQAADLEQISRSIEEEQMKYDSLRLYCEQTEELVGEQRNTFLRYQQMCLDLQEKNRQLNSRKQAVDESSKTMANNILPLQRKISSFQSVMDFSTLFSSDATIKYSMLENGEIAVTVKEISLSHASFKEIFNSFSNKFTMWSLIKVSIASNQQKMVVGIRFVVASKNLNSNDGQSFNSLAA